MLPYMDHRVLPRAGRAVPYTERGTFLLLSLSLSLSLSLFFLSLFFSFYPLRYR